MTYFYICFLSLHVHKTIKSNREIINGFHVWFEYIKLKIRKDKKRESIKLNSNSNNKQETNCSSLQIGISIINEAKQNKTVH
jgi:hypothetical protein